MLENLKKRQVNIPHLLSKSRMDLFDIDNPQGYIPTPAMYKFLRTVDKIKIEQNTIFEFYKDFDMIKFGDFGRILCQTPDLFTYLTTAIQYNHFFHTGSSISLEVGEETTVFSQEFIEQDLNGRTYAECIVGCAILHVFKSFFGQQWQPQKICVPHHTVQQVAPLFPNGNYPIETNLSRFSIEFDTSHLFSPNPRLVEGEYQTSQIQQFSDKVYQNLLNSKSGYMIKVPDLAHAYSTSVRTFIRLLAKEKNSFSALQSKAMYHKATKLLKSSDLSINSISVMLGYSDTSNFIRAFKQQTSLTPQQYRIANGL